MRKWIEKYKSMPPEMRTLAAAAGVGSFGTIVYTVDKFITQATFGFKPPISIVVTSVGMAVLAALFYSSGKIVSKGFSLRNKKRGEKMMDDMSGDLGRGPVSMDAREAVKENNKKFFEEIREMRKQTKLNVYDLPWYIVIGDSGCGKTRLIEHSGLTFSRGRPEGYQLGTLNYNWWFTEDAIFIDMAGRLCNPQEDADYKEWQGFLNTVAKGRPACPINGAIVCISAEHLLEDTPEKIEGDANTMLERLRDLQGKLGVTFATYVVVTKCDKILGFMQFFDRAERDVEVRNQLVGWTRPAPFTDLFDPEGFHEEFERLYQRLNELRVRRMNDDADEEELGMAYCLPEEFRELRDPLHTYLRVLFPPIKNPRAIKNLVARGVYFTSSLQQGSVILKHLKERMGDEAGDNIKPLEELYGKTKQRPLFIKHLLIRKVFPEYGLVFRNANEVARNKRYSRLLYIWSGVLAVVLFGLMGWGMVGFGNLIGQPKAHAKTAVASEDKRDGDFKDPSKLMSALGADVDNVTKGSGFRTFMAAPLVVNKSGPIKGLRVIQAGVFQRDMLPKIFADAGAALERPIAPPAPYAVTSQPARDPDFVTFKNALLAYARWLKWGQTASDAAFKPAEESDTLKTARQDLITLIDFGHRDGATTQAGDAGEKVGAADLRDAAGKYMDFLDNLEARSGEDEWPVHPAKSALAMGRLSDAALDTALGNVRKYFDHYVELTDRHPDRVVQEWIRRNAACREFLKQYGEFLKLAGQTHVTSVPAFIQVQEQHFTNPESTFAKLEKAYNVATANWDVRDERGGQTAIVRFDERIHWVCKETWVAFAVELTKALGGSKRSDDLEKGLESELWKELASAGMLVDVDQPYNHDVFQKEFLDKVLEDVSQNAREVITMKEPSEKVKADNPKASAELATTDAVKAVWSHLRDIQSRVSGIKLEEGGAAPDARLWADAMIRLERVTPPPAWTDESVIGPTWKPADLKRLEGDVADWSRKAETTNLLNKVARELATAAKDEWGIESLLRRPPTPADAAAGSGAAAATAAGKIRPARVSAGGKAAAAPTGFQAHWPEDDKHKSALGDVLRETVCFAADVQCHVNLLKNNEFAPERGEAASVQALTQLDEGLTRYFTKYVGYWSGVYPNSKLEKVQALLAAPSLQQLKSMLAADRGAVAKELREKLGDVLEHICWSNLMPVCDARDTDHNERVAVAVGAMRSRLENLWRQKWTDTHKDFVFDATRNADSKSPGDILKELADGWDALSLNIQNAQLGPSSSATMLAQLFGEARNNNGLSDERLTEAVLDLAARASRLINDQLKEDLCQAQLVHLGGPLADPNLGWPYMQGGGVADIQKFTSFLKAVKKIEDQAVQGGGQLPANISQFFSECEAWRSFLELDRGANPGPLRFRLTFQDARSGEVGVQNFYKEAVLQMGGQNWPVPIRQVQKADPKYNVEAQWDWSNQRIQIGVTLSDLVQAGASHPSPLNVDAGAYTALEFCKFLKDHASGKAIHVPGLGSPGGTPVILFSISLTGKTLPSPIKPPC